MRVTNSMMVSNYLQNLNTNMNKMSNLQYMMTMNRKYASTSDDPISAMKARRARVMLGKVDTYQENVATCKNTLTQTESTLMGMKDALQRLKELTVQASNGTLEDSNIEAVAQEVKELRDTILDSLNATFGSQYLFGGYNVTEKPFTVDAAGDLYYNGVLVDDGTNGTTLDGLKDELRKLDVGDGIEMDLALSGLDLILMGGSNYDDNLYALLDSMYNDMTSGMAPDVIGTTYLDKVEDALNFVISKLTEVGAKTSRLDALESRYEQDELNYTTVLSNAEDADEAEIIMQWMMAYSMYSAALSSGSYIIQNTLMDFLR